MSRIVFESELPIAPPQPERADVACFVGLVRLASSLVPEMAHKVAPDGNITDVDAMSIVGDKYHPEKSDIVLVKTGEIIPVDGIIIKIDGDYSVVDETAFGGSGSTLKSLNRDQETSVIGGSRNLMSTLTLRATANGSPVVPLSPSARDWLIESGWLGGPNGRDCRPLLDVPVPIESYQAFAALFDDGTSPASAGTDYLAVAVRSFFAQGGKKCYVVRMGDPVAASTTAATGAAIAAKLVGLDESADVPSTWTGIGHLWGLEDASFLLLPDLPILFAGELQIAKGAEIPVTSGPEVFVECVPQEQQPPDQHPSVSAAPRLSPDRYKSWGDTIGQIVQFVSSDRLREVQFVAALPLPYVADRAAVYEASADHQSSSVHGAIEAVFPELDFGAQATPNSPRSRSSAFLQLSYPWLRSTRSQVLLEGLEPPDGTLAGLLARNALVRGAFTSATKVDPRDVYDISPQLSVFDLTVLDSPLEWNNETQKPLITRVSLFGFKPEGVRLLSDVTSYAGESYRPASVNRLVCVICRNARHFGLTHIFENNNSSLWAAFALTLRQLMTRLWSAGALDGPTPAAAFDVRCDRSTMTQNDIDNGRMIAIVSFQAAAVVELIRVALTVETAGATAEEILQQTVGTV